MACYPGGKVCATGGLGVIRVPKGKYIHIEAPCKISFAKEAHVIVDPLSERELVDLIPLHHGPVQARVVGRSLDKSVKIGT